MLSSFERIKGLRNFVEWDYILSQYLEHTLLAPKRKHLPKDANNALKIIENVTMRIY